jgi:cell division protein FtsI (penicillin-binding protein 3)
MWGMSSRLSAESITRPDVSIRRALSVAAFIVFWMLAISLRLVYLQVSTHDSFVERARKQQQLALETSPERGQLLDRHERELARSIKTESIFVDPADLKSPGDITCTARRLAEVLRSEEKTFSRQFEHAKENGSRFVWIARRLSVEQAEQIRGLGLPGVNFRSESKRFYPNGSLAAHVLGFVGIDGQGLGGVEQSLNEKVSGEPGKLFLEKDSTGTAYEGFEIPAKGGQTIVLTIDQSIQYRTDQALAAAVSQSRAKSGTAIVLDPRSGEILALANAPSFDPNRVGDSKPDTLRNWALENVYEPGSTFKIIAFSAALEKGLVKPADFIDCQMGAITVAKRVIHDHKAFGRLTIADALAKSSNVAAIKLGLRVGDPTIYDYITRFGFGARTGIELPGETVGLVNPLKRCQPSSIGSIAICQEIGVTPLQMVAAFGAVANDGVRVAPHVVREIRSSSGAVVYQSNPEQRRVISRETASTLRSMLEGVTLKGTAKLAQLDGYSAAGKTGTAQKIDPKLRTYSKTKHVASFVGFAPVNAPAVVIIVVIDEPGGAYHGGDVAAPVFREIAEQILPELGVAPDTTVKSVPELVARATQGLGANLKLREAEARLDETRKATLPTVGAQNARGGEIVYVPATSRAILMPDLRGRSVRDVARACAQLGLQVEAHGEGRLTKQSPVPGTELWPGQTVYVEFARLE